MNDTVYIARLEQSSPSFASRSKREFPLEQAYELIVLCGKSLQSGGDFEYDFMREEGVSYNPRPARLACVGLDFYSKFEVIREILQLSFPFSKPTVDSSPEAEGIILLDRLRHLHLAGKNLPPSPTREGAIRARKQEIVQLGYGYLKRIDKGKFPIYDYIYKILERNG